MKHMSRKRENLAKAIYDVGKYTFTVLVIGQLISEKLHAYIFGLGLIFTVVMFIVAYRIDDSKGGD